MPFGAEKHASQPGREAGVKSGDPRISRRCTAPRLFDPSESSVRALLCFLHARHRYPLRCATGPEEVGASRDRSCDLRGRVLSWDGGGPRGKGQVRVRGPPGRSN